MRVWHARRGRRCHVSGVVCVVIDRAVRLGWRMGWCSRGLASDAPSPDPRSRSRLGSRLGASDGPRGVPASAPLFRCCVRVLSIHVWEISLLTWGGRCEVFCELLNSIFVHTSVLFTDDCCFLPEIWLHVEEKSRRCRSHRSRHRSRWLPQRPSSRRFCHARCHHAASLSSPSGSSRCQSLCARHCCDRTTVQRITRSALRNEGAYASSTSCPT